ncbi:energy transducer TonB [Hymenobacter sp. PAMC 26628]|uniref:energy transducer TonB n=1 Tax=Hymenobacter sp. PAMC 26628 TaxID=1484118 RepID=UPI0012FFAA8A|nr:energy transducer TonB [Hymenobacter sp. PAMC 26628]
MPLFPGLEPGDSTRSNSERIVKFINDSLRFPPQALRDGVQGRVFFSFNVNALGRATDVRLVQGIRADVDAEVLHNARRLERIQWRPGTQNGRPVSVSFTVPISFGIRHSTASAGDSLDRGPYQKLVLPLASWNGNRPHPPTGKGLVYGRFLQRLSSNTLGQGQYVRLVNMTTHKSFRINVKPVLKTVRENTFCYALPAGRYALFVYEFPDPAWSGLRIHLESILKPPSNATASTLGTTRYQFTVAADKLHYVGTWNLATENQPEFLNEKTLLDGYLQPEYEYLKFAEADLSIPK